MIANYNRPFGGLQVAVGPVLTCLLFSAISTSRAPAQPASRPAADQGATTFLSDLPERDVSASSFKKASNTLVKGAPTTHGLYLRPSSNTYSRVRYRLDGRYERFKAGVAIEDGTNGGVGSGSPQVFEVWSGDKRLWQSDLMQRCGVVKECDIPVSGVEMLELRVVCQGDAYSAHAVWVEPRLEVRKATNPRQGDDQAAMKPSPPGDAKPKSSKLTTLGPIGPNIQDRIPPDAPPELRALLKQNVDTLRSSKEKVAARVRAANALSDLGDKARPARRYLCEAMIDSHAPVRTAAADALKKIDPELHQDAVALVLNSYDANRLQVVGEKHAKAEPLTPLVAHQIAVFLNEPSLFSDTHNNPGVGFVALSRIAPDDIDACKLVIRTLGFKRQDFPIQAASVRNAAMAVVCNMKHKRLATQAVFAIFRAEPENVLAIRTLVDLADETTVDSITKAIAAQRYSTNPQVRNEVETALAALQKK